MALLQGGLGFEGLLALRLREAERRIFRVAGQAGESAIDGGKAGGRIGEGLAGHSEALLKAGFFLGQLCLALGAAGLFFGGRLAGGGSRGGIGGEQPLDEVGGGRWRGRGGGALGDDLAERLHLHGVAGRLAGGEFGGGLIGGAERGDGGLDFGAVGLALGHSHSRIALGDACGDVGFALRAQAKGAVFAAYAGKFEQRGLVDLGRVEMEHAALGDDPRHLRRQGQLVGDLAVRIDGEHLRRPQAAHELLLLGEQRLFALGEVLPGVERAGDFGGGLSGAAKASAHEAADEGGFPGAFRHRAGGIVGELGGSIAPEILQCLLAGLRGGLAKDGGADAAQGGLAIFLGDGIGDFGAAKAFERGFPRDGLEGTGGEIEDKLAQALVFGVLFGGPALEHLLAGLVALPQGVDQGSGGGLSHEAAGRDEGGDEAAGAAGDFGAELGIARGIGRVVAFVEVARALRHLAAGIADEGGAGGGRAQGLVNSGKTLVERRVEFSVDLVSTAGYKQAPGGIGHLADAFHKLSRHLGKGFPEALGLIDEVVLRGLGCVELVEGVRLWGRVKLVEGVGLRACLQLVKGVCSHFSGRGISADRRRISGERLRPTLDFFAGNQSPRGGFLSRVSRRPTVRRWRCRPLT